MDNEKEMKTPMHPTTYLGLDKESKKEDGTQYKAMIGSLLYLTTSKPDLIFGVCLCARFQKEPREVHLSSTKCIFRYLIGTSNLGLCFKRRTISDSQVTVVLTMWEISLKGRELVEVVTSLVATW